MNKGAKINTIVYVQRFGVKEELVSEAIAKTDGTEPAISAYIEALCEYYIDVMQEWP